MVFCLLFFLFFFSPLLFSFLLAPAQDTDPSKCQRLSTFSTLGKCQEENEQTDGGVTECCTPDFHFDDL